MFLFVLTHSWTKSQDLICADFRTSGFTNKHEERSSLAQGEQSVMLLTTMFIVPHLPQFVISFKEKKNTCILRNWHQPYKHGQPIHIYTSQISSALYDLLCVGKLKICQNKQTNCQPNTQTTLV